MIYTTNTSLKEFKFWAGAKSLADKLTYNQLEILDVFLEEEYKDGGGGYIPTETEINDLFWFNSDYICQLLGFDDEEHFLESINNKN